jgi:hypothetical protein
MKTSSAVYRIPAILLLLCIFVLHPLTYCEAACQKIRAVSLRAMQEQLQVSQGKDVQVQELLHFANLSMVLGYVVDHDNHDLVIVGEADSSSPPLYFEDFVVALRSAWYKYRGYDYPLCSIDPDAGVVQQLLELGREILSSTTPEQVEEHLQKWHRICRRPQKVRIEGIPFHSNFAQTMVAADYAMKSIADGSDSLAVPEFASLTDMTLEEVRKDIEQNRPVSVPLSVMNRFWFYPGENLYDEDEGIVMIHKCPVTLLTEEMYLSKQGFVPGGAENPLAKKFAENFTTNYEEISLERPVYAELANLFRLVALANIIKYKSKDVTKGFDLAYLLNDFPVETTTVPIHMRGRSNVKRFQHRTDFPGGYQEAYLWLPSCGGVGIPIPMEPKSFSRTKRRDLSTLRSGILTSRPPGNPIFWDCVYPLDTFIAKFGENALLMRINETSRECHVVAVEVERLGFRAYNGGPEDLYEGDDKEELLDAIVSSFGAKRNVTIYLYLKGPIPQHKLDAFESALRIAEEVENRNLSIVTLREIYKLEDYFIGEPQFVQATTVTNANGTWTTTFEFILRSGPKTLKLFMKVVTATAQIGREFVQRIKAYLSAPTEEARSLADLVSKVVKDISKRHKLRRRDLLIELKEIDCVRIDLRIEKTMLCAVQSYPERS